MPLIKVSYSTMGQSTPASVAEGTGWYRYKGKKPLQEEKATRGGHGPGPGHRNSRESKAERFRVFCEHRADDVPVTEAGELAGVTAKTARTYERERKEQRRREEPQP